jgi:hypothetical protein
MTSIFSSKTRALRTGLSLAMDAELLEYLSLYNYQVFLVTAMGISQLQNSTNEQFNAYNEFKRCAG